MQGVHEKMFSGPSPLTLLVDGQAPEECGRDDRIPREFLRHTLRPRANVHADSRKGVEPNHPVTFPLAQYKSRGHALSRVLPRLYLKVVIQRPAAAGKPFLVMLLAERLNAVGGIPLFPKQLDPRPLLVACRSLTKRLAGRGGLHKSLYKDSPVTFAQRQHIMRAQGSLRSFLHARNQKIRQRSALHCRSSQKQILLRLTDTRFKSLHAGSLFFCF